MSCETTTNTSRSSHQNLRLVKECSDYSDEEFFVEAITKENEGIREWTIGSKVNGTSTILKLDIGAQCNVMPNSLLFKLLNAKITKSKQSYFHTLDTASESSG